VRKIGVFICHCGRNIAGTVDVKKVRDVVAKHPYVVHAEDYKYMCSDPGQKLIEDAIKSKRLDGVVVACCTPTMHESTFREAAKRAGLNPYMVEIANIREQVSWVHSDIRKATEKAIKITLATVEKVLRNMPLEDIKVGVTRRALVVGGGIAGIQAALDIADAGYEVILVEKEPTIGGHMAQLSETFPTLDCSQCILTPKMVAVSKHPRIKLYTNSEVIGAEGFVGNFKVRIRKKARYVDPEKCKMCGDCEQVCPVIVPDEFNRSLTVRKAIYIPFPQAVPPSYIIDPLHCLGFSPIVCGKCAEVCEPKAINYDDKDEIVEEEVGAVILATGYELYSKTNLKEYGAGRYENVIDSLQFERLLSASGPTGGEIVRPSDGKKVKKIAFIQCAGSRDENHLEYCSKICCMYTAKHAMLFKHHVPDGEAYVFYIDIRAAGKGYEEFVKRAQEEYNVHYIRGKVSKMYERDGKVIIHAADTLLGKPVKVEVDLAVLAMGMVPKSEVAEIFRVQRDEYGFYKEVHPKLRPVESATPGVFICGAAHAPKDIPDSVAQASAAASKALEILSQDYLTHEPLVAEVNPDLCVRCRTCESVCPYGAVKVGEEYAEVNEVMCEGCGSCTASCPTGAISLRNMNDEQIFAMIKMVLGEGDELGA